MVPYLSQILFAIILITSGIFFYRNISCIQRNIQLGRPEDRSDNSAARWKQMLRVALAQSKMGARPVAGIFHLFIYVGFFMVNIEVVEIIIDGLTGGHRVLAPLLGPLYSLMTGIAEIFMVLVFVSCIVFLSRRDILKLPRFTGSEMTAWPRMDARIILLTEITLIIALVLMNIGEQVLQQRQFEHYHSAGFFPISSLLLIPFQGMSSEGLVVLERASWWVHIIGIFLFLNYIPFSKHLHVFLSFPNTYYSNSEIRPKGQFALNPVVAKEVETMLNGDPFAAPDPNAPAPVPQRFGAKDVTDLSRYDLLGAYTCTECGRCTSVCPAAQTGKKLSPRKIMMDTRDRAEEVGRLVSQNKNPGEDGKSLLFDYISTEEVWACTTCNACVEACPVGISPLSIIVQLRQYMAMEETDKTPALLNTMFSNLDTNQTPWAFPAADRFNWAQEIEMNQQAK